MIAQVYSDDNIEVYRFLSTDEKPLSCKHGSRALEIDTGRKYIFDAENSIWQEVHDSDEDRPVDAYTKEETQALLLTKVDKVSGMGLSQESYTTAEKQKLAGIEAGATAVTVDSALSSTSTNPVQNQAVYADKQKQDAALAEVENKGAKNYCPKETETSTGSGFTADVEVNIPAGTYILSFTGTLAYTASLSLYRALPHSGNSLGIVNLSATTGAQSIEFTITEAAKYIAFYHNGSGNNLTNIMISTKAEWDISHTYVPYGKTNAELTAENTSQQSEINYTVNTGAKNLLKNERTTTTHKGITFTINDDGSVTASGTNDGTGASVLDINTQTSLALSNGDYILTGCPAGGSDSGYMMDITRSPGSSIKDTGSGATFTVGGDYTVTEFRIVISRNITVNNLTFYPMIRPASITDSTFVPYAKTNRELTVENDSQQSEIDYAINTGVKNLLHFDAIGSGNSVYGNTYTHNGITYTLNADMTVTATGTADSASNSYAYLILNGSFAPIDDYVDGKHIVSGCPANGSTSKYRMYIAKSGWGSLSETGNGAIIPDKGNYTGFLIACFVSKGHAIPAGEPLVFKPMIRPASITDPTYEPYALPNPALTPAVIKAVDEGGKNIADMSKSTTGSTSLITRDGDTVTISGTSPSSGNAWYNVFYAGIDKLLIPPGTYIAMLTNINDNLKLRASIQSGTIKEGAWGQQAIEFTIPSGATGSWVRFDYKLNTSYNISFKLMICTAADWAVSQKFVPYCPTNRGLYETGQQSYDFIFGLGTALQSNDDLNNYNKAGKVYAATGAVASTILNTPWTLSGFMAITIPVLTKTTFMQFVLPSTMTGKWYRRRYTQGAWSAWIEYDGIEVT